MPTPAVAVSGAGKDGATESIAFWGHALLEGSRAFRATCIAEEEQARAQLAVGFANGRQAHTMGAVLVTRQAWEGLLSAVALMRVTCKAPQCEAVCAALETCHLSTRWLLPDPLADGNGQEAAAGPLRTHPPALEEQLGRLAVASEEECAWQALQQGHHWTLLFLVEVQRMAAAVNADAAAVRARGAVEMAEHAGRAALHADERCSWAALPPFCSQQDAKVQPD
eukprot:EG_transcript_25968